MDESSSKLSVEGFTPVNIHLNSLDSLSSDLKEIVGGDAPVISVKTIGPVDPCLELIEDIHNILLTCEDLTYIEKIELCSQERQHMKSYLKDVLNRVQNI